MERKIGEIFEYNGEWYQCIEGRCIDCYFSEERYLCKQFITKGFCTSGIIYKKLEKVGEPFACRNMSLGCYGIIVQRYKVFAEPILTDNSIKWCDSTNETILIALINKQDMEEKKFCEETSKANEVNMIFKIASKYINGSITYDEFGEAMRNWINGSEKDEHILKEFDIEAAKAGKPVCTRDGIKARIICFDAKGKQPIIALLEREKTDEEIIQTYSMNGRYYEFRKEDHRDLMMLPEKRSGWINVKKDAGLFKSREEAERNCTEDYVPVMVEFEI